MNKLVSKWIANRLAELAGLKVSKKINTFKSK